MKFAYIVLSKNIFLHNRYIQTLGKCNLLIFNCNKFYMQKAELENFKKDLLEQAKYNNCSILIFCKRIINNKKIKQISYISNNKIVDCNVKNSLTITIKNKKFCVGKSFGILKNLNKIVISKNRIIPNVKACSYKKIYLFCDEFGVNYVIRKILKRNFNKCSKIILK